MTAPHDPLPLRRLLIFSVPFTTTILMFGPETYLASVFARDYGLDLVAIGSVMALIGIFDAITDPLIGVASDKVRTRWGRRKPFIAFGAALSVFACFFLYTAPFEITAAYFLIWYFILQLGQTFYSIPKTAWAMELTRDYHARTRVFAYRNVFMTIGRIGFLSLPLLPIFATTRMTTEVFEFAFWLGLLLFPISILALVKWVPEGDYDEIVEDQLHSGISKVWKTFSDIADLLLKNPPFRYYVMVRSIGVIGAGLSGSVHFIFFDTYLGVGAWISAIGIAGWAAGLAAVPLWLWIGHRFNDKRKVLVASMLVSMMVFASYFFLEPGPNTHFIYIALLVVSMIASAGAGIVAPSLLGDVIDYGAWKTGRNDAAIYTSAEMTLFKLEFSAIGGIGLMLLGLAGYDPSAETNTAEAVLGLKMIYAVLPVIFMTTSVLLYLRFPIDKRRQEIIAKRLAQRAERARRAAPSVQP